MFSLPYSQVVVFFFAPRVIILWGVLGGCPSAQTSNASSKGFGIHVSKTIRLLLWAASFSSFLWMWRPAFSSHVSHFCRTRFLQPSDHSGKGDIVAISYHKSLSVKSRTLECGCWVRLVLLSSHWFHWKIFISLTIWTLAFLYVFSWMVLTSTFYIGSVEKLCLIVIFALLICPSKKSVLGCEFRPISGTCTSLARTMRSDINASHQSLSE